MRTIKKILKHLDEPRIAVKDIEHPYEGWYNTRTGKLRIDKHTERPQERVLIHEMLHHLYPKKKHSWIDPMEEKLWKNISRKDLEVLRKAVNQARRK